MKPPQFEYARPSTLDGALAILTSDEDAKVLGGGQSLVPMLNFRLARPTTLVDLCLLPELKVLERRNGTLVIGAGVSQRAAEISQTVLDASPLISVALRSVGHLQTRSRGTIGGSLAHADPAAELPAVALVLDATMVAASPRGIREIPAGEFFLGPYTTALEFDEILIEVRVPASPDARVGFRELARRAGDFAMAGVAVHVTFDGERVKEARLAALGVEATPVRLDGAEQVLADGRLNADVIGEAAKIAAGEIHPKGDSNATGEHRRELVAALLRRALTEVTQ